MMFDKWYKCDKCSWSAHSNRVRDLGLERDAKWPDKAKCPKCGKWAWGDTEANRQARERELELDRKLFGVNNRVLIAYDEYRSLYQRDGYVYALEEYYEKKKAMELYNVIVSNAKGKAVL